MRWCSSLTGIKVLEWGGTATGILGAALLALNNNASGWGFVAFLASNLFWMAFGFRQRAHGLVTMQVVFTATSVAGIHNWLLR